MKPPKPSVFYFGTSLTVDLILLVDCDSFIYLMRDLVPYAFKEVSWFLLKCQMRGQILLY